MNRLIEFASYINWPWVLSYLGRVDQFQLTGDCASIEGVVSIETRARNKDCLATQY